ncbi:MAG: flagellar hook-associated protein FlgK [Betaproteobacteria bacterium]
MSVGLLNVGASALLANQAALQTAGNNIANVNTPGYSRQSVLLAQVPGQDIGAGYVGRGVAVTTVLRDYSAFLDAQANLAAAQQAADSTVSTQLTQLENIFPGGSRGIGASVSTMLNSFSAVASAPTDLSARTVALANANQMAALFRSSSTSLDQLQAGVQTQLQQSVSAINSLATQIAAANDKIAHTASSGQTPNELLDQRDQLITRLNQYVQTTSIPSSDGGVTILLAGSQAIVQGASANPLLLSPSTYPGDLGSNTLTIKTGALSAPMDESNLGGGSVKGLMSFLNQDLVQGRNLLGRMALAIGTVANTQHKLGLDMSGNAGGNLFQLPAMPLGLPASTNGGTNSISMSVSDPTKFAVSDYQLTYTSGTAGNVTRWSDGKVTAFDFAAPPVVVDGLGLSATTGAVAGDRFLLKPFSTAASQIDTAFTSPKDLAMASQIQAAVGSSNVGGLALASMQARSANPNLTDTVSLTFNAAAGTFGAFDVTTASALAAGVPYTPGQPISFNGWSLTLSGLPKGLTDSITVQASNPAYANTNSGNATALVNLRDMSLFDGAPLTDGYAGAISQVGVLAQGAAFAAATSLAIAADAQTAKASVSGVNLDEEAAKLLQFQQAYQASAKVLQMAQTLFTTLISSFGP